MKRLRCFAVNTGLSSPVTRTLKRPLMDNVWVKKKERRKKEKEKRR